MLSAYEFQGFFAQALVFVPICDFYAPGAPGPAGPFSCIFVALSSKNRRRLRRTIDFAYDFKVLRLSDSPGAFFA